jgi:hypothetical protein
LETVGASGVCVDTLVRAPKFELSMAGSFCGGGAHHEAYTQKAVQFTTVIEKKKSGRRVEY